MILLLGAIIFIMLGGLGLVFWPRRFSERATQVAFGTSLATGAVISLAFFVLQGENQANQDRLARKQTFQLSIALERDLSHADLQNADLGDLNLAGKNLSGADLRGADLSNVDLTKTNLSGAQLVGANLRGATLTDANLARARMQGADLGEAQLRRANLSGAVLGAASGGGSDPAQLVGARLLDARLSGACLSHANMREAQLGGADLGSAVLTGADLRGARLQVDGVFANLRHVAGIASAQLDTRTRAALPPRDALNVQPSPPIPAGARPDLIAEVSDGDTLRLASGRWIRLVGVNAWATDEPEGMRAAKFLRGLQHRSPEIRFTLGEPADESFRNRVNPPGRLRAYVWLSDGTFLNAMLLARGYTDRQYPDPAHLDDPTEGGYTTILDEARARARDAGRGIWSTCPAMPLAPDAPSRTGPALVGMARLPATSTAQAPWPAAPDRGIRPAPHARQPIGGLSALVSVGPRRFLTLTDNGFGQRGNSRSFLLRVHQVHADLRGRAGGEGELHVEKSVTLRDPHHRVPFRISTAGTKRRLLTGGDFDPESLVAGRHGDLWIGDEFGPYLLHFDRTGVLLEPPIPLPQVKSPDNVLHPNSKAAVTLRSSQGIEGLAMSPTGERLYAALEGPVRTHLDRRRRLLFEYDVVERRFTARRWDYRVDAPGNAVSDLATVDAEHLLVLEKGNATEPATPFARVFEIDLQRTDQEGYVQKRQALDLLNIKDPHRISANDAKPGTKAAARFTVPGGVEAIVKRGTHELGVINDDNVSSAHDRGPGRSTDLAIIALPRRFGA